MGQGSEAAARGLTIEFVGGPKDGECWGVRHPPPREVMVALPEAPTFAYDPGELPDREVQVRTGLYALKKREAEGPVEALRVTFVFSTGEVEIEEYREKVTELVYFWEGEGYE